MSGDMVSVLVIDDEPAILETVELILQHSGGYEVHTAANAAQSLEMIRRIRPDVILCDAQMPVISGMETISLLKADDATAHIPIVLMTGSPDVEQFSSLPLKAFLQKPFGPQELKEAIQTALLP
jgi:CheY-like chemotaxis protein